MKKIIIVLFLFVCIYLIKNNKEEFIIPSNAIRFRVIANSNTFEDQATKMEIKTNIENILKTDLISVNNKTEADKILTRKIPEIETMLKGYKMDYNLNYGDNYFPEKSYKGVKYPSGTYESLVVTLGSGKGENWWCVLYPPLCMMDNKESNLNNVEYASFIEELFNKYL
ncbi:MAG: stage II sporulation protein R [Bacilli bacterium]|nr:stage II sporulation protein R [Bacilli bacterium]